MRQLHQAQIRAQAALLDAIEEVLCHDCSDSLDHKIQIATDALAEHARLATLSTLRLAAESVLIDRLAEGPSTPEPKPDTINRSP